jgi:hypothetical protein
MSVKHQHPSYTSMVDKWKRCIDVCEGQDKIHEGGSTYLPRLIDQTDMEYAGYRDRTPFYNATWRTLTGLQGMLFRKPPAVNVPEAIKPMLDNITMSGTPLHMFALEIAEESLKLGRVGVFVDYPIVPETATAADSVDQNFRPLLKMYKALSIINWKTCNIKNATVLSMVVLKECAAIAVDEFMDKEEVQYRVLDLTDITLPDGGVVKAFRVRVFKINEKDQDVLIQGPFFPKVAGKNLTSIPFQFMGVDDVGWDVDQPPLIDLVDMNLSHYRTTADYEHGCHFTGLPTPVISGYTPTNTDEKFYIGSMSAWLFPRPDAKASYLEFTGQGLKSLSDNMSRKEGHMAILGARMLEVQTGGVESANTAAIHRGGEQSTLSSVSQAISIGLTKCLKVFCEFAGQPSEDVSCKINKDFFAVPMDALTLTAIIAGWQNGAYSYDTMFENLKKGEIVPCENTPEDEQANIKANPAPLLAMGTTPGSTEVKGPKTNASPATPAPTIKQLQNK